MVDELEVVEVGAAGPSVCAEARRTWSSLREAREALVSGVSTDAGVSELIDLAFLSVAPRSVVDSGGFPAAENGLRFGVGVGEGDSAVTAAGADGFAAAPWVSAISHRSCRASVSMRLRVESLKQRQQARTERIVVMLASASSASKAATRSSTRVWDSAQKDTSGRLLRCRVRYSVEAWSARSLGVCTRLTRCSVEAGDPVQPTRRSTELGGVTRLAEQPAHSAQVMAETTPWASR